MTRNPYFQQNVRMSLNYEFNRCTFISIQHVFNLKIRKILGADMIHTYQCVSFLNRIRFVNRVFWNKGFLVTIKLKGRTVL